MDYDAIRRPIAGTRPLAAIQAEQTELLTRLNGARYRERIERHGRYFIVWKQEPPLPSDSREAARIRARLTDITAEWDRAIETRDRALRARLKPRLVVQDRTRDPHPRTPGHRPFRPVSPMETPVTVGATLQPPEAVLRPLAGRQSRGTPGRKVQSAFGETPERKAMPPIRSLYIDAPRYHVVVMPDGRKSFAWLADDRWWLFEYQGLNLMSAPGGRWIGSAGL